ncbi:unnamed protein product [Rhodiola kirilowii]
MAEIRVARVRQPWWMGDVGVGILLQRRLCDSFATSGWDSLAIVVWLSAEFWDFKSEDAGCIS